MEACAGGENATCAEGYEGVLCTRCASDHYKAGLVVCSSCPDATVSVIRSLGVSLLCLFSFVYIYSRLDSKPVRMAAVRILTNFLHFLLVLPLIAVNWQVPFSGFLSFVEMVVSFGLHSVSIDCWVTSPVLWRAVISTSFPLLLLLILLPIAKLRSTLNITMLYLWWTQPYITKTLILLVACKYQGNTPVLLGDSQQICWNEAHFKYVFGLFLPGFLLYCIGYTLLFFLVAYRKSYLRNQPRKDYYTSGLLKKNDQWELRTRLILEVSLILTALLGATDYLFQVS